eukprot:scaffold6096_cov39-Cyclotella_meneghiniana.AAC.3
MDQYQPLKPSSQSQQSSYSKILLINNFLDGAILIADRRSAVSLVSFDLSNSLAIIKWNFVGCEHSLLRNMISCAQASAKYCDCDAQALDF